MSKLNKTFTATLQRSPNKGGWTYVVMPGSAQYFKTRGLVKIKGTVDDHPFESSYPPLQTLRHRMLSTLVSVWFLHVAAMLSPGANVLLVSQLAASDRARSAAFAALGVTVGAGLWASCAVLGVNAVFEAFPRLRLALQVAGGLYLLYVASRLWRSNAAALNGNAQSVSPSAAFRLGLLTNITNPKSALFFGSVFAASFPADPSSLLQASAVAMVVVNALCWHTSLAYMFSRQRVRAAYSRKRRTADRVAAAVVGALGLHLLVASLREARS